MKIKNLALIFSLLLITALSGAVVFVMEKKSAAVNPRLISLNRAEKPAAANPAELREEKKEVPGAKTEKPAEQEISVSLIIEGKKFDEKVAPGGSVYDLMEKFKQENKISFSGKNYSGLGFFVEEINGAKNDPGGKNWVYYLDGKPAQVGVSNLIIKNNNIIEWKYEKKSF